MQVTAVTNNVSAIKGETVSELVRRHLRDQHHTTTEEELRNVMLDTFSSVNNYSDTAINFSEKLSAARL